MATTVHETDLRYPVGRFDFDAPISESDYPLLIATIAETPSALRSAVAGMSRDQLETRYRPGGWTVKQVVHHVPDSHLNAYTRFKLALTEDEPTIKPYNEAAWAELADSRRVPIEVSLELLDALDQRAEAEPLEPLGHRAPIDGAGRLPSRIAAPGARKGYNTAADAWLVRVAREASRGPHHFIEEARRLVTAPRLPLWLAQLEGGGNEAEDKFKTRDLVAAWRWSGDGGGKSRRTRDGQGMARVEARGSPRTAVARWRELAAGAGLDRIVCRRSSDRRARCAP